jgi:hypothetical protein
MRGKKYPPPLRESVRVRGGHSRGIRALFPWAFAGIRGHSRAFAVSAVRDCYKTRLFLV